MADLQPVETDLQTELTLRLDVPGDPDGGPGLVVKLTDLRVGDMNSGRIRIWRDFSSADGFPPEGAPDLEFPRTMLQELLGVLATLHDIQIRTLEVTAHDDVDRKEILSVDREAE